MKKVYLLLALAPLALTACHGDQGTPAVTSLSGKVVEAVKNTDPLNFNLNTKAWTGGAGKVNLTTEGSTVLASGALNADGSFSLALPANVEVGQLKDFGFAGVSTGCTGDYKVSDPNARGIGANLSVSASKSGEIMPLLVSGQVNNGGTGSLTIKQGGLFYVDRNITIKGSENCTDQGITYKTVANVNLSKGWNYLTLEMNLTGSNGQMTGTSTISSGGLPTTNWVFGGEGLGTLSLKQKSYLPKFF